MRKVIDGEVVEGTPDEILAYEMARRTHMRGGDTGGGAIAVSEHASMHPSVRGLTNDDLIERFRRSVAVTPQSANRYAQQVRLLADRIAPRSLVAATPHDIAAVRDELLSRCVRLGTMRGHTRTPGVHFCKQGLFLRALDAPVGSDIPVVTRPGERPDFCNTACAQYEFTPFPASTFLNGVKRFFDTLEDVVPRNPAKRLMQEFSSSYELDEFMEERYCPTLEEVGRLLRRAKDPRTRSYVAVMAKTGRRPDEVRLLRWEDVDLERGLISLARVRDEKRRAAGRGRTKMRAGGFKHAFVDDELARILRDYRKHYWEPTVRRDEHGQPLTTAIWLNRSHDDQARRCTPQGWIDAALHDAGMVAEHGPDAPKRITAHCFRHFFTTILQTRATPAAREFVKLLRGDMLGDAMQRYEHIPLDELQQTYRRHMPRLVTLGSGGA